MEDNKEMWQSTDSETFDLINYATVMKSHKMKHIAIVLPISLYLQNVYINRDFEIQGFWVR